MMHRRVLYRALALVGIVAFAIGGPYYAMTARFNPTPPDIDYPKPGSALEAQRQDIDYYGKLIAMDRSYSPTARSEANKRLAALAADTTVFDRGHMRVALLKIAALADNGHTQLYSKEPVRSTLLPIRVVDFSDGIHVMRVKKENADLLGARVIKIEGRPVEDVLTTLEELRGGTKAWRRNYAVWVLTSSEYLYGLGIAGSPEQSTWSFLTQAGATVERTFFAYQPDYDDPLPPLWRWLSASPVKGDKIAWEAFAPRGSTPPAALQDPDRTFRRLRIAEACTMLVQLKSNGDENGDSISDFLETTEADIRANRPCSVIFDDRFNGGGDYTNTARFAGRLPSIVRPGGHIYILTGTDTFSAGITTAVFVKQAAAPNQTVILGQPVGDRLTFWAEGADGCLPHAPFCFHYATAMHDYANKCEDWNKCYWLDWIYPARTDSVTPNETIGMSFEDYLTGRDPAYDRALALAKADVHLR